jgi:hypothetical protein
MNRRVLQTARTFSRKLIGQRAEAVVLFGSWVRNDAYKESDLDINVVGRGSHYTLERYQGFLVSTSWATARQVRQAFKNPSQVGGVIPAWRNGLIIHDPHGIAKALKQEAERWQWDSLGKRADRWVAEELTGYAEEVHRLVGNLQLRRRSAASVQRSVLAIRMAPILAVHHRILYETENQLWDLVSERMGADWAQLQSVAFGEGGQSFEETCRASLNLYSSTAREVIHLLNQQQRQVVAHACEIAANP